MTLPGRLARVTGQRLYARDHHPRDKGWPGKALHALYLRATRVDLPFTGLDLDVLREVPGLVWPPITASDLARDKVLNPRRGPGQKFGRVLVVPGDCAELLGQPVALLFFEHVRQVADFLESRWLQSAVEYRGPAPDPAPAPPPYATYHLIRYPKGGTGPDDEFSYVHDGPHDPTATGPRASEADRRALEMQRRIEQDARQWQCLDRTFHTPSSDPMFMEPEAGIGWWEQASHTLHLVLGTQSPSKDVENVKDLCGKGCAFRPVVDQEISVDLTACPPGGGFGGRDESSFPLYLALAALYARGRPVRLAYDRSEQFLTGIKRHAAVVRNRLHYSPGGDLQALESEIGLDGGGELNLTAPVLQLAALHAAGPYRIPRTAIHGTAFVSASAPAGSMRGFGIPQVTFAIESMIDELATGLGQCPIQYRLDRVLRVGDRDAAGMELRHHLATGALCREAMAQPLWRDRARTKAERDRPGVAYGVGFACCMEAFGASSDAAFAGVELTRKGTLAVCSSSVDMGQGSETALSLATRQVLGQDAAEVVLGDMTLFEDIGLDSGARSGQPGFTPKWASSVSASMTAFFHVHAVEQACRILFQHGLLPAARALWGGEPPGGARWKDGALEAEGRRPLGLPELARKAHEQGHVVGARVHTFFQNRFATATFPEPYGGGRALEVDALAVARGKGVKAPAYEPVARTSVSYPRLDEVGRYRRTLHASVGHVLAVEVDLKTGRVQLVDAVTVLDAGEVHHLPSLEGQAQGGLAMGIGMALTEELPPAPPSMDGDWNLGRYIVPRVTHLPPLERLKLALVELEAGEAILGGDEAARESPRRKKGIAEAAMTTVPPAAGNAIAHATGMRLTRLPFTEDRVLEALASR